MSIIRVMTAQVDAAADAGDVELDFTEACHIGDRGL